MDDSAGELGFDGLPDFGHVVADHVGDDSSEKVQVGVAVSVDDPVSFAADDLDRRLVVQGHPRGHDRAVAGEQIRHGFSLTARRPLD